jgi:glucose/mannose transport system substrate-binding protein
MLALLLFSCGAPSAEEQPPASLEIFSWWSSQSEARALEALLEVHEKKHPDLRVINAADALADKARARLADRMRRGLPPDTFQANIGRDLFEWVLFGRSDDDEAKVQPLNDLARDAGWFDVFPPPVLDALSFEGRIYGVPLNIHRLNTLFYNKRVLDDLGLQPPATLVQLHEVLAALVRAGYSEPLAIGSRYPWTLTLLLMENLFPAIAGAQFYAEYWRGEKPAEHELMQLTLAELLRLWPYFNADAMDIDWTEGVERVLGAEPPRAVMTVMGDWAKGHLQALGYEAGRDFDSLPFPDSVGSFVFTVDCFALPKGAPHKDEVTDLLLTFGSHRGQLAFSALKGSLPARSDIDPERDLDVLAQRTWQDFGSDQLLTALSGMVDADFASALGDAIKETLLDRDPDPVLFALRNNL